MYGLTPERNDIPIIVLYFVVGVNQSNKDCGVARESYQRASPKCENVTASNIML
jgi:hypothetical protein